MIKNVLVLGAGSAGLIAALTLKRKIPQLNVRIVRSPELGVIGVGEGTTPNFPEHMFKFLGISRKHFYAAAQPTWKLGIRFLWGPRDRFDYGFSQALDAHWSDLPRPNGFYCDDEFRCTDMCTALMAHDKAFVRQPGGIAPDVHPWFGFHIENKLLVETLENIAVHAGVEIIDGKVSAAEAAPAGSDGNGGADATQPHLAAVVLEDGRRLAADFFIDSSGFRSELLGKALGEPYVSYSDALLCDRAVVGGWERGADEPILPYTTAETMDAGWSWRIDHERHVNRGYVYCSSAISDEQAADEFKRKNPKAPATPRVVKFRSGRYRRGWVGNVVGMGNACGFVEPLEATALMVVCAHSQTLTQFLQHTGLNPTPTIRNLFNHWVSESWDEIRDFLALHYKLNTRLQTPFWRQCVNDIKLGALEPFVKFYEENGPTGFSRHLLRRETGIHFGVEGFLVMMVGNRHPYHARYAPAPAERATFDARRADYASKASGAMNVQEALSVIRRPEWQWHGE